MESRVYRECLGDKQDYNQLNKTGSDGKVERHVSPKQRELLMICNKMLKHIAIFRRGKQADIREPAYVDHGAAADDKCVDVRTEINKEMDDAAHKHGMGELRRSIKAHDGKVGKDATLDNLRRQAKKMDLNQAAIEHEARPRLSGRNTYDCTIACDIMPVFFSMMQELMRANDDEAANTKIRRVEAWTELKANCGRERGTIFQTSLTGRTTCRGLSRARCCRRYTRARCRRVSTRRPGTRWSSAAGPSWRQSRTSTIDTDSLIDKISA